MGKLRVLLVDDEKEYIAAIDRRLTVRGFIVRTALNGLEALNILRGESFDVIVMDQKMPVMDGIETLKEIRKTDTMTPVLFISCDPDLSNVTEALKIGATNYLNKVSTLDEIISAIENAGESRDVSMEANSKKRK